MTNPLRIGYINYADDAVISASSQVGTKPVSLLADPHPGRRWAAASGDAWVNLMWPEPVTLDCLMLRGCVLTPAGGYRVTASDTVGGADLYDSGDLPSPVDPRFAYLIHILPAPVTTRTLRLTLSDPTVPQQRGGRLYAGPLWAPKYGDGYGRKFGRAPLSTQTVGRAGQVFTDRRSNPRATTLTLGWVTLEEERQHVREIQRRNANTDDVLVIFDKDDPNLGDVSLWGLAKDMSLPSRDYPQLVSLTLSITERM